MRSTTEGEVLLTRLLGGEGSALGDMVRFVSSRFLKIKMGFLILFNFSKFFNKAGFLTGGWRRCYLGWHLLDSKSFAPFLRSN